MKSAVLIMTLAVFPVSAFAAMPGKAGVEAVHRCIMENDAAYCHAIMTPDSVALFDRFSSYKLMPCLPTDFTYAEEESDGNRTTAKVTMPAGGGQIYIVRLVFMGTKLSIPASFERGLGTNWQDKIELSEQLYLMMRQNMGDKLTCDKLDNLIKAH